MITREQCTGIILCGGRGSRLGHDKALLMHQGSTLAERAAKVLSAFCSKLIISTNNPAHNKFGIERVPDIIEGNGPMMGIYSALVASKTKHHLVIAVDNFNVGTEFYHYLLQKLDGQQAAVPYLDESFYEPLCGYYNRDILPEMKRMIYQNRLKLPELLDNSNILKLGVTTDFEAYHEDYFHSINVPEDLLLLRNSD